MLRHHIAFWIYFFYVLTYLFFEYRMFAYILVKMLRHYIVCWMYSFCSCILLFLKSSVFFTLSSRYCVITSPAGCIFISVVIFFKDISLKFLSRYCFTTSPASSIFSFLLLYHKCIYRWCDCLSCRDSTVSLFFPPSPNRQAFKHIYIDNMFARRLETPLMPFLIFCISPLHYRRSTH